MRFNFAKTNIIELGNGEKFDVDTLPLDIQKSIHTFDHIKHDVLEKNYELNVLELALEEKRRQIQEKLTAYSVDKSNA